jgi:hypothetical protein
MEAKHKTIPHLAFVYPDTFSDSKIDDEISEIKVDGLDVRVIKKENGVFNGFEWIIPTAFVAYILKPYFDAFLSEAGKDHYNLLKSILKKMVKKGKVYETKAVASTLSPDKLSKGYSQSLTVSIEAQTVNNRHLKLLFDNDLSIEDWNEAIEQFIALLSDNYSKFPNDTLTKEIEKLQTKQHKILYLVVDPKTKRLELKDDLKMLESYK